MELTKNNLTEWKAELNRIAEPYLGKDFADCLSDEEYLKDYLDEDTEDVLRDNLSYL